MPSRGDLQIYQGDDYSAVVQVLDIDDSAPLPDLTGCTTQAQIREGPADDYPDVIVEIATAVILPNLVTLTIPAALTIDLCGTYSWDLQLNGGGFIKTTVMAGKAVITPEVTREVTTRRKVLAHA